MPGTVQDLSRKLLSAIDPEGNVKDMGVVLEVVDALEGITVTADDIRTNCLGRNINQLRRKLTDSNKSLARRLKKLVKTWQQLIQSQTPNGLTTPSLGGGGGTVGGANKAEPPVAGVNQKLSNQIDSRRRSVSSSREGTPSLSTVEPLSSKSGPPVERKNASRTPTPTPSPCPPPPPPKSSSQAPPTSAPSSATPLPPPPSAPVIPRPTKAQDFARNRIRRMQMFSAVKKPTSAAPVPGTLQSQPAPSEASTAQTSTDELALQPQQQQESVGPAAEAAPLQSHSSQQTSLQPVSNFLKSSNKAPDVLSHLHSLSSGPVANGSRSSPSNHASLSPSPPLSTSRSSHTAKLTNSLPKTTASLSQIVTNSFNHEPGTSAPEQRSTSHTSSSLTQSLVAHKVGVQDVHVQNENSNSQLDSSPRVPESLNFVVKIPRNLLHRQPIQGSKRNDFIGKNEASKVVDRELAVPSRPKKLIVSIDLSILQRVGQTAPSWQRGRNAPDVRPNRTEQVVMNHHDHSLPYDGRMELPPTVKQNSHKSITSCDFDEPMETDSKQSFGTHSAAFTQPQLIPSGAYPGVDGCLGNDGYWYAWTDLIPGHDEAVTVLPYIYVDDDSCEALVDASQ